MPNTWNGNSIPSWLIPNSFSDPIKYTQAKSQMRNSGVFAPKMDFLKSPKSPLDLGGVTTNPPKGHSDIFGKYYGADAYGGDISKAKKAATMGTIGGIGEMVTPMVDPVIQAAGGREADNITGFEQLYSKGTDMGISVAAKSGNPWLMAVAGGLKGLDWLNRYAGKRAGEQGTSTMDTGAYAMNLNAKAGQKDTLLGSIFGKTKKTNNLTSYYDKMNLNAGNASYANKQNQTLAMNSFDDNMNKNKNQLFGGFNSKLISAKKGAKINPAQLRNLVKKAQKGIKIYQEDVDLVKFQDGGKFNVIPEGALHARKHTLPEEISESVTGKGIPVITYNEGGEIEQHAEIELNEIIFNKDATTTLEKYFKDYNSTESKEEKNNIAIECGKFIASEILENTIDNTGLLTTVE